MAVGLDCTHLHVALGDVERGDTCVGDTASKDTTEHALGIVAGVVGHRPKVSSESG
jgi:hypothetical protein